MTVLFWVIMVCVLLHGYGMFKEWREDRAFRKQLKDRSDWPVDGKPDEEDLSHL